MAKRDRHERAFWTGLVEAYERGGRGEKHQEFADRHRVGCASFRRWLYRLRDERRAEGSRAGRAMAKPTATLASWPLVEVQGISVEEARLEVELANGRRVLVPASFDAEALRRLLAVVAEPAA